MSGGAIVAVGRRLEGDFAGADAGGRHVAVLHGDVLTVYDVHGGPDVVAAEGSGRR